VQAYWLQARGVFSKEEVRRDQKETAVTQMRDGGDLRSILDGN
jgi:hypothetical protein